MKKENTFSFRFFSLFCYNFKSVEYQQQHETKLHKCQVTLTTKKKKNLSFGKWKTQVQIRLKKMLTDRQTPKYKHTYDTNP